MKKRILLAVLAVICIVIAIVLIDPGTTKPWTWASRLSAEDVDEIVLWGNIDTPDHVLSEKEIQELVKQINRTNRLQFQKNKALAGPTTTCGFHISVDGEEYNLNYYGIFELRYGENQWWIRSERFSEYMDSLLEQYNITIS